MPAPPATSAVACSTQTPLAVRTALTSSAATETSEPSKLSPVQAAATSSAVTVFAVMVICGVAAAWPSAEAGSLTVWSASPERNASGSLPCAYCHADQAQKAMVTAARTATTGRQTRAPFFPPSPGRLESGSAITPHPLSRA